MIYRILLILAMFALGSVYAFAGEDTNLVIIKDFKFMPRHIEIKTGQTVIWENREKRQYHSVWFEALGEDEPEDYLFPEDVYQRSFNQPGTFPYRCGPHAEMTGSVTVSD